MTNMKAEGEELPPYTVHEQFASEPRGRLLGPPLSRHGTTGEAIEEAQRLGRARQDKAYAVCTPHNVVIWPL